MAKKQKKWKKRKKQKTQKKHKTQKISGCSDANGQSTVLTSTEGCLKETGVSYRDRSKFPLLCFFIVKTGAAKAISHIAVKSRKK